MMRLAIGFILGLFVYHMRLFWFWHGDEFKREVARWWSREKGNWISPWEIAVTVACLLLALTAIVIILIHGPSAVNVLIK